MATKSILIVDDDSAIRKYLSYTLNSAKYQVELATDGYEALTQARNYRYDLAIVDLVLPGEMNGMDIINSLKTISPDTRVIATSAYSGQAFSDKTARAGADMFITKTLLAEQLIASVESLLGKPAINSNEFIVPADHPFQSKIKAEDLIMPDEPAKNQEFKDNVIEPAANPSLDAKTETNEFMPDKVIIPTGRVKESDNGTNHNGTEKTDDIFKTTGAPSRFEEKTIDESVPEKLAEESEFAPEEERPFAGPTNMAAIKKDESFTPHILKKLPKDTIANILTLGRLIDVDEGKQVIVNYTGQVVIVRTGRAKCKYGNKYILSLNKGDAVGEECLLLDYDPQFRIIIEAEQALQLIIIPKDMLNDYFKKHDISFFIGFQLNVTLSLSKKLRRSFAQLD